MVCDLQLFTVLFRSIKWEASMYRLQTERRILLAIAVGAGAGASAAAFAIMRLLRRRQDAAPYGVADMLEDAAIETLRSDRVTGSCAIDVAAIGPGIIELTGTVPSMDVAQRAARLLHSLEGVRTVVNRLQAGSLEQHLAENRERRAGGEPGLSDRRWLGMSVGMGRRRQSPSTEPDRPDDSADRLSDELDVQPSDIADATSSDSAPTTNEPPRH
jgi:hypothetical protein